MPWLRPIFLIKIVSAVFEIFRKKETKKPFFSCTITILDHTLYRKVKIVALKKNDKIEIALNLQDKLYNKNKEFRVK